MDNYLNSVTTGIELRLTVSPNKGIFCLLATEEVDTSAPVTKQTGHLFWKGQTTEVIPVTNTYFYKQFRPNPCKFEGQVENKGILLMQNDAANCTHSVEMTLDRISNVRIQMISTNHPDDNIVSMLTGIALKRGLFYPHQMCICTPFNFTLPRRQYCFNAYWNCTKKRFILPTPNVHLHSFQLYITQRYNSSHCFSASCFWL